MSVEGFWSAVERAVDAEEFDRFYRMTTRFYRWRGKADGDHARAVLAKANGVFWEKGPTGQLRRRGVQAPDATSPGRRRRLGCGSDLSTVATETAQIVYDIWAELIARAPNGVHPSMLEAPEHDELDSIQSTDKPLL